MIITRLFGGLGNQMFQYAAGLALAEARRTVLKLDTTWFRENPDYEAHNRYALSCLNITEQFATDEEIIRCQGLRLSRPERWAVAAAHTLRMRRFVRMHECKGNWHVAPSHSFYPEFTQQPDGTFLDGMFQSEKFFAPVAPLLRMHFTFRYPSRPDVTELAARIQSGPSAALHFRRGDYARNPAFAREMGVLNLDYYRRAVDLIRARSPEVKLYLFSDDIDAVADQFKPEGPHEYVRCVHPAHAHETIRLMSLCDHIAIANSTFSWWAAWLNPSPDKLVITPDPWFVHTKHDARDLVPAGWHRLAR